MWALKVLLFTFAALCRTSFSTRLSATPNRIISKCHLHFDVTEELSVQRGKLGVLWCHMQRSVGERLEKIVSLPSFPHFVAGISAGALECIVGHPFDTIRVRVMSESGRNVGALQQFFNAVKSPIAMASLYRGLSSELLSSALAGSLLFGVNDFLKRLLGVPANTHQEAVTAGLLWAAFGTGALDGITSKPLEMIKLREQAAAVHHDKLSVTEGFKSVLQEGGVACLFRGWLPTVLREAIGNAAFFAAYHEMKNFVTYLERKGKRSRLHARRLAVAAEAKSGAGGPAISLDIELKDDSDDIDPPSSSLAIILAGAAAGFAYVIASHPLETASVLMQIDIPTMVSSIGSSSGSGNTMGHLINAMPVYKYTSMSQCLREVIKVDGLGGLYRGMVPTVVRSLPQYAASFWGYETTLLLIEKRNKQSPSKIVRHINVASSVHSK